MIKHYVLDTNVLLYDPNSISMFDDNNIHIPMVVLEELDRFKKDADELGANARQIIGYLDSLRSRGKLRDGVTLDSGGKLYVSSSDQKIDSSLSTEFADNKLLQLSFYLKSLNHGTKVVLVTKDINLRVKADALGIDAQDYKNPSEGNGIDHEGIINVTIDEALLNDVFENGGVDVPEGINIIENQYVILESSINKKHTGLGVYRGGRIIPIRNKLKAINIKPRNVKQAFAFEALMNPDIKVVTLSGVSGTGKTLLAISSALQQTLIDENYYKITITRPTVSVGKELGFLPGDIAEKLDPWIKPIYDAIDLIKEGDEKSGKSKFSCNIDIDEYIEIAPLCYIRGRSLINSFMIIDECLTADHLVWSEDGKCIPIQDMNNGIKVISYDINNKKSGINIVSNCFSRKTNKLIKLKTTNGEFECSETHKWWVYENGIELKKKDARDLTNRDLIIVCDQMPHYEKNNLSKNTAKLLALILTDGHIDKNLNEIKFEFSKDKDWLLSTFNEITKNFNTSIQKNEKRNTLICRIRKPNDIKEFVGKFNLIAGNKSNLITVPDEIWNSPIESVKEFIRTCFDAEGDVNYNKVNKNIVINFSSTSKIFAKQIKSLLLKFSISSNLYHIKRKNEESHELYRISIINDKAINFLETIGFSIKRKQDIYEEVKNNNYINLKKYPLKPYIDIKNKLNKSTRHKKSSFSYEELYKRIGYRLKTKDTKTLSKKIYDEIIKISEELGLNINECFSVGRINSIEKIELDNEIDVYDFTVENDHTFIVDGILTSNCQNLSPLEIKTITTRVGQGTKIVFTGDVCQIDSPYLNKYSNGLSQLIKKFKGQKFYAHITLTDGERSEVAEAAAALL